MSNPYESGSQKIIPAVLLYAFHQNEVLMIHRNIRANDFHEGKWNGLGGKLESGETYRQAAVREFEEEAGTPTLLDQWNWMGQLYFPNFKAHKKEDWMVNVFTIELNAEQKSKITVQHAPTPDAEGTLHWIASEKVIGLNLWDGDQHFIPFVLKKTPFQGTFFYENGRCSRHEIFPVTRLP